MSTSEFVAQLQTFNTVKRDLIEYIESTFDLRSNMITSIKLAIERGAEELSYDYDVALHVSVLDIFDDLVQETSKFMTLTQEKGETECDDIFSIRIQWRFIENQPAKQEPLLLTDK